LTGGLRGGKQVVRRREGGPGTEWAERFVLFASAGEEKETIKHFLTGWWEGHGKKRNRRVNPQAGTY